MSVAGASGSITWGAGSGRTILHWAAVSLVCVEDLRNAALRGVRHPVNKKIEMLILVQSRLNYINIEIIVFFHSVW